METLTTVRTVFGAPEIECDGCASAIKKALSKVKGVSHVGVDVDAKTVVVDHDTSDDAITVALDRIGFPATVKG